MKIVFAAMAGLFVYVHFRFLDEMVKGREMHQKSFRMNRKLHAALIRSHTASAKRDEDGLEEKSCMRMGHRKMYAEVALKNRIKEELDKLEYYEKENKKDDE